MMSNTLSPEARERLEAYAAAWPDEQPTDDVLVGDIREALSAADRLVEAEKALRTIHDLVR